MRFALNNENFSDSVTDTPVIGGTFDATANNSSKTFTVPDGETWKLNSANVVLVSTATVGNRQIRMEVFDASANSMGYISAGAVQAASLTRNYGFMQGIYRETAFVDGMIQIPIPVDLYLPAGYSIKFFDFAAIDAAADDMTVSFQYKKYKGI